MNNPAVAIVGGRSERQGVMGLDFRMGNGEREINGVHPQWAGTGFHRFRTDLARQIGVDLDAMVGFGGTVQRATVHDPIVLLLHHSDCDGEMAPEECRMVAPRLRELVALLDGGGYDHDRIHGTALADMMDAWASQGVPLVFG